MSTIIHPHPDEVRKSLRSAIARTYDEERELFVSGVHERSLIFHIGRNLATEVAEWKSGMSVDVEYNRWNRGKMEVVRTKYLDGFNVDGKDRNVFPDLIVHDRSGSSRDHNILVLEAKRKPTRRDRDFDYRKLQAFEHQFSYQQAVFLEFPARGEPPRWTWVSDDAFDPRRLPTAVL